MKKIMAVYDEDPFYAERLSDYVNRKEKGVFFAQAFTSRECLQEYARENEIDVLLMGLPEKKEEIPDVPSRRKIYLAEEPGEETGGKEAAIYKYQSGDDIIREVMAAYCEAPETAYGLPGLVNKKNRIIGIYSPGALRKNFSGSFYRTDTGKRGKSALYYPGYLYRLFRASGRAVEAGSVRFDLLL